MHIPKWFTSELASIDPKYFIEYNDAYNYYEIKHHVEYCVVDDWGRVEKRSVNPTVAVFQHLNDAALTDIRRRKKIGEMFARLSDKDSAKAYRKWIVNQNAEAKRKAQELADEMMTKGFMKIHKLQTSKTFS